jgi:inhibitor of cysteine peptidase
MSRRLVVHVALLALIFTTSALAGSAVPGQGAKAPAAKPGGSAALRLSAADGGKTASARVGQTVIVSLRGNPTTGFNWSLDPSSVAGPLQPVGQPSFAPDSQNMGSGGILMFTLSATKPGKSVLRYVYRRSWETTVPPAETVNFTVEVK